VQQQGAGLVSGLRLPLVRRPDPVLTDDELDTIGQLLVDHIRWARGERAKHLVSESVIRTQIEAEAALAKIAEVRPYFATALAPHREPGA
jgi:hypothetical protein